MLVLIPTNSELIFGVKIDALERNMKKTHRIALGIIVTVFIGFVSAYNTVQQNGIDYQAHPAAAILGAVIVSPLAGLIFYWLSGVFTSRAEKQNIMQPSNGSAQTDRNLDIFYTQVASELQNKFLIPGLWTKAYAEANGDESKARAFYIKYRVAQLAVDDKPQESKTTVEAHPNKEQKNPAALLQNQVFLTSLTILSGMLAFCFAIAAFLFINSDSSMLDTLILVGATAGFGFVTFNGLMKLNW